MENAELLREFEVLEADSKFITKNTKEFSEKYPEKFIAVWDSRLVAVDSNFEKIMEKLKTQQIDPSKTLIEFIPAKGQIVLY